VSNDIALCAFKDGMVSVYNTSRKQVEWSTEGGHTETIFDCGFNVADPNILATASYDSTVRLWDIRNSTCVAKLMGATGVLYSLAWSPDGNSMASSCSEGKVRRLPSPMSHDTRYIMHEGCTMCVALAAL
jgi:WD40 repeat protein